MALKAPELPVCPHCGQRMLIRYGVRLPPFLADLFNMIEHSGSRGVLSEVLAGVFYSGKPLKEARRCLYTNIHHINGFLVSTDFQIKTAGGETNMTPIFSACLIIAALAGLVAPRLGFAVLLFAVVVDVIAARLGEQG